VVCQGHWRTGPISQCLLCNSLRERQVYACAPNAAPAAADAPASSEVTTGGDRRGAREAESSVWLERISPLRSSGGGGAPACSESTILPFLASIGTENRFVFCPTSVNWPLVFSVSSPPSYSVYYRPWGARSRYSVESHHRFVNSFGHFIDSVLHTALTMPQCNRLIIPLYIGP
jgi:hypothetical protein